MSFLRGTGVHGALAASLLASACAWNAPDEQRNLRAAPYYGTEECLLWGPWVADCATPAMAGRLEQARLRAEKQDFEGALRVLDQAAEDLPPEPALHAARASVLVALGFPRAAEAEYVRALNLDPDCPHLWRGLGFVRLRLGLEQMAENALHNARCLEEAELGLAFSRGTGPESPAARAQP